MLKSPADGVPTHRGRPIYHMQLRLDSGCNDESPTHPGPWIHDPWPQISLAPNGSDPLVIDPTSYIKKTSKSFLLPLPIVDNWSNGSQCVFLPPPSHPLSGRARRHTRGGRHCHKPQPPVMPSNSTLEGAIRSRGQGEHRVRYHTEDESGNVDHRYPRPGGAWWGLVRNPASSNRIGWTRRRQDLDSSIYWCEGNPDRWNRLATANSVWATAISARVRCRDRRDSRRVGPTWRRLGARTTTGEEGPIISATVSRKRTGPKGQW